MRERLEQGKRGFGYGRLAKECCPEGGRGGGAEQWMVS
jgi:hypothetical protein